MTERRRKMMIPGMGIVDILRASVGMIKFGWSPEMLMVGAGRNRGLVSCIQALSVPSNRVFSDLRR